MKKAGQKFLYPCKLPPTKFYMESNWKFLNERGRPQIPISPQTLSNEIRFRIELKLSELKKKTGQKFLYLSKLSYRNSTQNQIQTFWMEKAGQKFLYLRKLSPTKFDSESNSNFLTGKSRPKIPISSQTSPNRILFGIKLKNSDERGRPQIPISPQTLSNGIRFRIKLNFFWIKKTGQKFLYLS